MIRLVVSSLAAALAAFAGTVLAGDAYLTLARVPDSGPVILSSSIVAVACVVLAGLLLMARRAGR